MAGLHSLSQLLMKASPQISPLVKEEAMKLAREWRSKVTVTCKNGLEVFGLLHFIASYKLASAFNVNKLHNLLDVVGFNGHGSRSKKRRNAALVPRGQPEQSRIKYNLRSAIKKYNLKSSSSDT